MPCFCYILECADGSLYTGWTTNPERRIKAHNAGGASRYTRARRPVRLVLLEPQVDRLTAMRRERAIKMMSRANKLRLIKQVGDSREERTRHTARARRGRE
jgi:putative endonuclease